MNKSHLKQTKYIFVRNHINTYHIYFTTQLRSKIVAKKGVICLDTHDRIRQLLQARGWTEYRLSKECGLAQSTIGNILRRNTVPSVATIETICKGFGISVSQFFAEGEMVEITPELRDVFDYWAVLTPDQKAAALQMLKAMSGNR